MKPIILRPRSLSLDRSQVKELSSSNLTQSPTLPENSVTQSSESSPSNKHRDPYLPQTYENSKQPSSNARGTGRDRFGSNASLYSISSLQSAPPFAHLSGTDSSPKTNDGAIRVGEVVVVQEGVGVVRYQGACHLGPSTYVGIQLAEGKGTMDGISGGHKYFECAVGKGILIPVDKIKSKVSPEKLLFKMVELRQTITKDRRTMKKQRNRMLRQASHLKEIKDAVPSLVAQADSVSSALSRASELQVRNRRSIQFEIDSMKDQISTLSRDISSWTSPGVSKESEVREFLELEFNKRWFISKRDVHKKFKHVGRESIEKIYKEFEPKFARIRVLPPHDNIIYGVAASHDNLLLSGSDDCTIRFWRLNNDEELICVGRVPVEESVNCVCFSPDGMRVGAALHNGKIELWDAKHCKRIRSIIGQKEMEVWALIFSLDSKHIVSGSLDAKIRVWNQHSADCIEELVGHETWVNDLDFNSTGEILASGSGDFHVRIWDFRTFECLHVFQAHPNFVRSVRFAGCGKLISSGEDGTICIWETAKYTKERTIKGHTGAVLSLSVHRDFLLSASSDRTTRLWDINTGQLLHNFQGHTGDVNTAVFFDNGMWAVSGSDDSVLRLWNLATFTDTV